MRQDTWVAYRDGIGSGIPKFRFILRQCNGGGFDWALHCSPHMMQRVQEY